MPLRAFFALRKQSPPQMTPVEGGPPIKTVPIMALPLVSAMIGTKELLP
jgi:hypothetical protein